MDGSAAIPTTVTSSQPVLSNMIWVECDSCHQSVHLPRGVGMNQCPNPKCGQDISTSEEALKLQEKLKKHVV